MLQPTGLAHADVTWVSHCVPGTEGFTLLDELPTPYDYDYFIWKGVEPDLHPYGACYHDLHDKLSTGVIEYLKAQGVSRVIVGGLALDYCVKTTALQLLKAGLEVVLHLPACRGITRGGRRTGRQRIAQGRCRHQPHPRRTGRDGHALRRYAMESAYDYETPVIQGLLDTDYYTFTMMQAVLHQHPNVDVEYNFIVRSKEKLGHLIPQLRDELEKLAGLQMREGELRFLFNPRFREYLTPDYERFLGLFRFNLRYIHVSEVDGQLNIRVVGPMLHCIMFEQPVLALVSELRNRDKYPDVSLEDVTRKLYQKFDWLEKNLSRDELADLRVSDFSTRRRLSFKAQREVVDIMRRDFPGQFVGTSNAHLAYAFDLPLIGTMAHQWLMVHQQLGRLRESQNAALENWVREYRGRLGIALTDCISTDFFLKDFDLYFAKLYDGLRQDSGDPIVWADKVLARYKQLGIDPMTKDLMFSDGLNFEKCLPILRHVRGKARFGFGMGTSLACDVEGVEPLSIVMKLVRVHGEPVVKFSDDPIKNVCEDASFLRYATQVFNVGRVEV